MTTRIKLRRDTAANWTTTNPILAAGEPGLESDTGKIKYGDGVTRWNVLEHQGGDTLVNEGAITVQTGDADRWFVRLRKEGSNQDPQWEGVIVYSTNYDSEGNVLVLGNVDLEKDGVVVFKFTSAGELVWKKSMGPLTDNSPYWIGSNNAVVDADDNLIFSLGQQNNTAIIVKVNGSTGAVEFSNAISFGDSYWLTAIGIDSNSNIIVGGRVYQGGSDTDAGFVAKLNTDATAVTWQHTFTVDSSNSVIYALEVDFNDDIIVVGSAEITVTINGGGVTNEQILVAKVSAAGSEVWQKVLQLDIESSGEGYGLSLDSIGNSYVTGTYYVDGSTQQFWGGRKSNAVVVLKMTTAGVVAWDRRVGPGECDWVGVSTAVGEDGDLYLYSSTYEYNKLANVEGNGAVGYWNSRLILARYNKATGAVIWQSYFDNPLAQEIPGYGNDAPWGGKATDLMSVKGDKILIGGAVRLGQSAQDLYSPWGNSEYFNQGFLAQFDTDATKFSVEGWELKTSRVPGRLTNSLEAVNGPASFQTDINITTSEPATISATDVGVSVRRTASKVNTWTFGKDGTLTAPVDSNIKLQQTQLGFANLYGILNHDDAPIWYESVCHDADGNAYTLGSDYRTGSRAHVSKFTPEGELVWRRQLHSGAGATFYVEWSNNEYTLANVQNTGSGYKVGDKIVLRGSDFGGTDGVNSLVLEVTAVNTSNDFEGSVSTVNIISGVAPDGSSDNGGIQDYYDDAECNVRLITYDPVTSNVIAIITTPTYNGDTRDSEWTETVAVMIDAGSGVVLNTKTLADEGDVYPYDANVSSTGKIAIVGEKFNEYNEYGAITPLPGSDLDWVWLAKSDIDAEHYPGEPNSYYGDWFVTGSTITDQIAVTDVNYYTELTGDIASRPGTGLVVDVTINLGQYSSVDASSSPGLNYLAGQKFKITGDLLGGTTPANDLTFIVGVGGAGDVTAIVNIQGTAGGIDQVYSTVTPTKVNGSGANFTLRLSPVDGSINSAGIDTQVGQDYLVGDVITIPGTSFAGGTSPTNDITVTVTAVGTAGDLQNPVNFAGTGATTHIALDVPNVDFAEVGATFAIKQSLGAEAFVWTPDFTKAIGGGNSDKFSGVVWNSAGTHLYAVGSGRYEVNYDQALVVKFAADGTIAASKYINQGMGEQNAYSGAVALMADDSIVVVYEMSNNVRNNGNEVLVTKLDSDLNILWQQFIGYESTDGWVDPDSQISVAVDPATDEILLTWDAYDDSNIINDDAIIIVKLDTDGEILWKRMFGIHESDSGLNFDGPGNKALSIHGNKFTIVGFTDGPVNDGDNAFIVTLPLDGTGTGLHDMWTYAELKDDRLPIQRTATTAAVFTPTVHSNGITMTDNVKHYYTNYPDDEFTLYPTVIRSEAGGAIEFADGSKQTFSAAIIPQVKSGENRYTLKPEDSGRHILVESDNYALIIPNWERTTLPVGYTITIVNISGNQVRVECEGTNNGQQGSIWFSGGDTKTPQVGIDDNGSGQMVTLIKFKEGTTSDDGDNHGDLWMIAGADISDTW